MDDSILVEIQLFAGAAEIAGCTMVGVSVPIGANLTALRDSLVSEFPELRRLADISRWAVNEEFVADDYVVEKPGRLAMIPPVSGG